MGNDMQYCKDCSGLIMEPNINYSYSGKICYCPINNRGNNGYFGSNQHHNDLWFHGDWKEAIEKTIADIQKDIDEMKTKEDLEEGNNDP